MDNLIGDEELEKLSRLITSLNLSGSQLITDKGLQHLARMPQLRELRQRISICSEFSL